MCMYVSALSEPMYICPGTAGSSEIIIQGQIVSAAENNNKGQFGTIYWELQGRLQAGMLFGVKGLMSKIKVA